MKVIYIGGTGPTSIRYLIPLALSFKESSVSICVQHFTLHTNVFVIEVLEYIRMNNYFCGVFLSIGEWVVGKDCVTSINQICVLNYI